jgi:hypothetical protein
MREKVDKPSQDPNPPAYRTLDLSKKDDAPHTHRGKKRKPTVNPLDSLPVAGTFISFLMEEKYAKDAFEKNVGPDLPACRMSTL